MPPASTALPDNNLKGIWVPLPSWQNFVAQFHNIKKCYVVMGQMNAGWGEVKALGQRHRAQ